MMGSKYAFVKEEFPFMLELSGTNSTKEQRKRDLHYGIDSLSVCVMCIRFIKAFSVSQ